MNETDTRSLRVPEEMMKKGNGRCSYVGQRHRRRRHDRPGVLLLLLLLVLLFPRDLSPTSPSPSPWARSCCSCLCRCIRLDTLSIHTQCCIPFHSSFPYSLSSRRVASPKRPSFALDDDVDSLLRGGRRRGNGSKVEVALAHSLLFLFSRLIPPLPPPTPPPLPPGS